MPPPPPQRQSTNGGFGSQGPADVRGGGTCLGPGRDPDGAHLLPNCMAPDACDAYAPRASGDGTVGQSAFRTRTGTGPGVSVCRQVLCRHLPARRAQVQGARWMGAEAAGRLTTTLHPALRSRYGTESHAACSRTRSMYTQRDSRTTVPLRLSLAARSHMPNAHLGRPLPQIKRPQLSSSWQCHVFGMM